MNFSAIEVTKKNVDSTNIDILKEWPESVDFSMDKSQMISLKRMLTKRLAIIQGPPGTGKTHVSIKALVILLANWKPGDPPIIVTAQTNHALDQLLRLIASHEPNFVRLGGQSKDKGVVERQTLRNIRESKSQNPGARYGTKSAARRRLRQIAEKMQKLISTFQADGNPIDEHVLHHFDALSKAQVTSLQKSNLDDWVDLNSQPEGSLLEKWLDHPLIELPTPYSPDHTQDDYENPEAFLVKDNLNEEEAELTGSEDKEYALRGPVITIAQKFAAKESASVANLSKYLNLQDLWEIPKKERASFYNFLVQRARDELIRRLKESAIVYKRESENYEIARFEEDATILKGAKIIGMTTTGLSKYRSIISALCPKIVLVEEAAETFESYVTVACMPSLEHLILVGDHQQLRPQCNVREYEGDPWNLNVSMFERLVMNEIEYTTIRRQRRMIPEIRRLLNPIYGSVLKDHPLVKDLSQRPPVPGMGGCSSYFFHHTWSEIRDEYMSSCNRMEAEMIVGFVEYLVLNGMSANEITILTFYNGQRKLIVRLLRENRILLSLVETFRVVTVDSYQGEENEVILLSLVRSNDIHSIGFLNISNRVCVALSRAKRGLYLFGNAELLAGVSKLWAKIVTIFWGKVGKVPPSSPARRIGFHLPLECRNHRRKTYINGKTNGEGFYSSLSQTYRSLSMAIS